MLNGGLLYEEQARMLEAKFHPIENDRFCYCNEAVEEACANGFSMESVQIVLVCSESHW